jgi:hypothetical protein
VVAGSEVDGGGTVRSSGMLMSMTPKLWDTAQWIYDCAPSTCDTGKQGRIWMRIFRIGRMGVEWVLCSRGNHHGGGATYQPGVMGLLLARETGIVGF